MPEGRRADILLFAGALALRLAWIADLASLPFFDLPTGDSLFYARRAASIARGDLIGGELAYPSSVLYPYLAAPFFLLGGRATFAAVYIAQAVLDALHAVLLRRTGALLFGRAAGWFAGIAWAGYGLAVFFTGDLVEATAASLAADLFLALLLASSGALAPRVAPLAAASGLAYGAAVLLRPHLLPLLPLAAALALALCRPPRRLAAAAAFVLGAGLLLSLSLARNVAATGQWILVAPYGGLNAYLGNHPAAGPYLTFPAGVGLRNDMDLRSAASVYPEAMEGRPLTPAEVSRFWWRETLRVAGEDPAGAARRVAVKAVRFWSSHEPPNHLDFGFFRDGSVPLALAAVPFGLLAPLALLGVGLLAAGGSGGAPGRAVALLAIGYGLVSALFFLGDRFRLPATGWIALLAGGAFASVLDELRRGRRSRAAILVGVAVLLGLALHHPVAGPRGVREHVMVASSLAGRGRDAEAERLYGKAIDIDPGSALARFNLGRFLLARGRRGEAETQLREAVRLAPDFAAAHAALSDLLRSAGPGTAWREPAARAIAIEPWGPEADRLRSLLASAAGG